MRKAEKARRIEMRIRDVIADMTRSVLTDNEILTEKTRNQIRKALEINCHLTSSYMLQVAEVQDIKGRDSKTSGFYFVLEWTRCGVKFFLNNDMEIVRKPNKNAVEVKARYSLWNHGFFHEGFWCDNF